MITLNDTHIRSVRLPWVRDRPVAEAYTCTTQNIHKRQTSIPPAGFEAAIPASERPQMHALDRAATEIGTFYRLFVFNMIA
jgi:hypothetical protein